MAVPLFPCVPPNRGRPRRFDRLTAAWMEREDARACGSRYESPPSRSGDRAPSLGRADADSPGERCRPKGSGPRRERRTDRAPIRSNSRDHRLQAPAHHGKIAPVSPTESCFRGTVMRLRVHLSTFAPGLLIASLLAGHAGVASAQTQMVPYFGKNNIHYDTFEWQTYETEHFTIYFYPAERQHLERVAGYAESAYQQVSADLRHELSFKIPLVIFKT